MDTRPIAQFGNIGWQWCADLFGRITVGEWRTLLTGSAGTNYSDYLYWNPSSSSWAVGSSTIHIGKDAGLTGQATYAVAIGWEAGKTSHRGLVALR
jgi:hypothetical protein